MEATAQQASRRALTLIFLTVFLDLLGVGILMPVSPFIVRQYHNDALTVGLLALSFSAAQFFASPIMGALGDRYGRRPVLIFSLLGTAFGYFLFGWATTLWLLFLSRFIDGVTGGNISTAQAYIADVSAPEDRAKNFGLIGAAFGLGFIVGPALGGILSKISLTAPAFAAGILSLLTVVAMYFFLPESLPEEHRRHEPIHWRDLNPIRQITASINRPGLGSIFLAWFLLNFAMSGLQTNFAVFSFDRFAMGPEANAAIFAVIGTMGAFTQGFLLRRIAGKTDGVHLVLVGAALSAIGFFGIAWTPTAWGLYPACISIALGVGLASPSLTGLLSKRVSMKEQGSILGVSQALASFTRALGPVWAGALYDRVGAGSPYWTGALWLLAALVAVSRTSREASTPSSRAAPSNP